MPRQYPVLGLDGTDAAAYAAIQTPSRLSVLRALLCVESASRPDIEATTGLKTTTTLSALRELQDLGYVVPSTDGGSRSPNTRYSVRRDKITTDLLGFIGWLISEGDD